jgi:hypothetical protein
MLLYELLKCGERVGGELEMPKEADSTVLL